MLYRSAYGANYTPAEIPAGDVTHLLYAFGDISDTGEAYVTLAGLRNPVLIFSEFRQIYTPTCRSSTPPCTNVIAKHKATLDKSTLSRNRTET